MRIDRKELLGLHNPKLDQIDTDSPLTVGNGDFAFTADVTGMQTLYDEYEEKLPLCTMSTWGWHTIPAPNDRGYYTLDDLKMTEYDYEGRTVTYPKKKMEGNEEVYDWLRKNPHRLNLINIGLEYQGSKIKAEQLTEIHQKLDLYEGIITSEYQLDQVPCRVETFTAKQTDTLGIRIESELLEQKSGQNLEQKGLSILMRFPYGSSEKSASDWNHPGFHVTQVKVIDKKTFQIFRTLDADSYEMIVHADKELQLDIEDHEIQIFCTSAQLSLAVDFSKNHAMAREYDDIREDCIAGWKKFWEQGAVVRLNQSKDARAIELERRIILSQYLMAVNSSGSTPPQETGLTCNSWYGKMHLEMYLWHCAWLPLWNNTKMLEKSLDWYLSHRKEAAYNAQRNGFKGIRWPKMIANEGIDCPSAVAPLLIWQQPHIVFMLELAYQNLLTQSKEEAEAFLYKYWVLVKESAEFMVDFAVYNKERDVYELLPPLIPVQECHSEKISKNPAFELEYWRVTLKLSTEWAERIGKEPVELWNEIAEKLAVPAAECGVYLAHENCPDTFAKFNRDHPSMLGAYGMLYSEQIDPEIMRHTLDRVIAEWKYETLWGWDFAVMAMTAARLGEPEKAIDILLKDTFKNRYVVSGNNLQEGRADLPLYLPGNGSILLAIPLMVKGWKGCQVDAPGFPKDGSWVVESDGLMGYFE